MKPSKKLSLAGMVIALNTLSIYASETLPFARFIFAFVCSLFIFVLVRESLFASAWLCFLATAVLTFFILPNRLTWFFYVALLGHFGIVRQFLCNKVNVSWLRSILLVIYCNIGCALAGYALFALAGVNLLGMVEGYPLVLVIILAQICFFVLDIIYNLCTKIYNRRIREHLVK